MYQNKAEDSVITPAHLLLIPSDSGNSVNFLNFSNIGVNTLRESSAFTKIRNFTKVYNSHLVHTPSLFTGKYNKLNSLYLDENSYLTTSSFGVKKQHNLYATSALGNSSASTLLDSNSFNRFLHSNLNLSNVVTSETQPLTLSALALNKPDTFSPGVDSARLTSLLKTNKLSTSAGVTRLSQYPSLLENINDSSDKEGLSYPSTKLISPNVVTASLQNNEMTFSQSTLSETSSATSNPGNSSVLNTSSTAKLFNLNGPNSKVLLGDQSIRNLPDLSPNKSNLNLSTEVNTLTSNITFSHRSNKPLTPFSSAVASQVGHPDYTLLNNVGSSRSLISSSHPAVLSSSVRGSDSLDYDNAVSEEKSSTYSYADPQVLTGNKTTELTTYKKSPVGEVFVGSREKTPRSINTAY